MPEPIKQNREAFRRDKSLAVFHFHDNLFILRSFPMAKLLFLTAILAAQTPLYSAVLVNLGTADSFAVLGGSTVTNTGFSTIHGDLGVWPGSAITGFPPGLLTSGAMHISDAVALQAQTDLGTAWNAAAGQACNTTLTGTDLGGLTLTPGVYCFASSAQLTGTLTLNALGNANAVFIFQIGSTLISASNSSVAFTGGGQADSLFWQVGSSATLGTTSAFAGNILALTSITMNTNATLLCGRALARNGAVTLDTNTVSIDTAGCETIAGSSVPEPAYHSLLLSMSLPAFFLIWKRKVRQS
jgi:hypothetical protein